MLLVISEGVVIYLIVVVNLDGVICCVLLDIGVGSLYVLVVFVK